jgi:Peptidase A4 family
MTTRISILIALMGLTLLGLAACTRPALGGAKNGRPSPVAIPATAMPSPTDSSIPAAIDSGAGTSAPSGDQVNAIQSTIQKANQAQAQALAANNPAAMQDTATASYYQQSVQILNDLVNSGVTAIQLVNLSWGPITLQDATTAQATSYETWSTTFSDGNRVKQTDTNVYTLVLQNGSWKVQEDQHPNTGTLQPSSGSPSAEPPPAAPGGSAPMGKVQPRSRNWSGYAASGGSFTAVSGTWKVPNVTAVPAGTDATWVGIGGVRSTDLIQAGTQAIALGGRVRYSAWWETLPQASQRVPLTLQSGDTISVSIAQQSDGTWLLAITDATSGQTWQKNLSYGSSLSSAEWVEEAPALGGRVVLPLDAFGSIQFSGGATVENGQTHTIAQAGAQAITMDNRGAQMIAVPSALATSGDSFTVSRTNVRKPLGRVE